MQRNTAYLTDLKTISVKAEAIPPIADDDVLVQMKSVGICGSDISYYNTGRTGVGKLVFPHVLGHESAGVIVGKGNAVTRFELGDRVVVEPGVPCGKCKHCLSGHYNRCEEISFMSTAKKMPYSEGAFTGYSVRPSHFVYRLPDTVSFDQGAMIEPLSVAFHSIERSGVKAGQKVAIIGCGPIAGCVLLVLRSLGIGDVTMTDMVPSRLECMDRLGAKRTQDVKDLDFLQLKNLTDERYDVVFDTSCNENAINAGIAWLEKGGNMTLIGVLGSSKNLDLQTLFLKEASLVTSFRYVNTYPRCISMIANGLLDPLPLVSHHFPLDRIAEAFELACSKKEDTMKIIIDIGL